jgi:hypothetical protein
MDFSDDPLSWGGVAPHIRDDLKFDSGNVQAKIYRSYEVLVRIEQAQPTESVHQPPA